MLVFYIFHKICHGHNINKTTKNQNNSEKKKKKKLKSR